MADNTTVSNKMPRGIPYIIGNELAERFSYYGMKTILVVFMTQYIMNHSGQKDLMNETDAIGWYHWFSTANYFFPIVGAFLSDILWGKYKTIITLSIVYCLGHLALALDDTRLGLSIGLTLIAIGSGGIKPCVSAHVGDQFQEKNKHLLEKVFSFFYLSINIGAAISSLLTPVLLNQYGPHLAFGIPGALMLVATIIFYMGRHKFIAIKPAGWETYKRDLFSPQGKKAVANLFIMYLFIAVFWALYDQTGSSWVIQAGNMDRTVNLGFISFTLLDSQIQAINPVLVLTLIPIFSLFLYPKINKIWPLTPLRKISIGMFITALSYVLIAIPQGMIDAGGKPGVIWQVFAYVVLTLAEILISITGLEFSYTQAPNTMKSFIMGLWLLSVSFGNFLDTQINSFVTSLKDASGKITAAYFWFYVILMGITAVLFLFVAMRYKEESYIQSREDAYPDPLLVENP
ncbi:MAG: POT family MFS transporter [Bacteroidetes bacterium]|nr:POT family MFS transporter [Bacteroidota bacterium]